jgi:hypothetical protein
MGDKQRNSGHQCEAGWAAAMRAEVLHRDHPALDQSQGSLLYSEGWCSDGNHEQARWFNDRRYASNQIRSV